MDKVIRVGTRESRLAIVQSNLIINDIKEKFPNTRFELIPFKTKGDIFLDTRLDLIGGKGLFVKELENALISNSIDIAVHSMKDMPVETPDELVIGAVSKREDPRDVLVTQGDKTLDELPKGAVVGTSSQRREIQILNKRPDLKIKTLRGNVLTRLDKLLKGEYDAIILAAAGLKRLGLAKRCTQYFEVNDIIPAVGQGIMGAQIRKDDDIQYLLNSINCEEASFQLRAERAYMERLDGSCSTPIGGHAVIDGDRINMYGMFGIGKDKRMYRAYLSGDKSSPEDLGKNLADEILMKINKV